MSIRFDCLTVRYKLHHQPLLRTTIRQILADHLFLEGEIQYVFCNSQKSEEVNIEFLGHHYPTDIITFPYTEGQIVSSELWICTPQVRKNALSFNQTFEEEMHRVVFHGILHLVGYDDHLPEEVAQMRRAENHYLEYFKSLLNGQLSR